MPSIDSIAEEYVERAAALDPFMASYAGIPGHDHELPDLSADGFAGRAELDRSTLAVLAAAEPSGPREQAARAAMRERLAITVECYDAGDTTSQLNVIDGWVQYVRELFDLMPTEGEEAAANIAARIAAVPEAYRQLSQTLLGAARNGRPPARLQVEEVAKQCAAWARPEDSYYSGLVRRLTGVPDSLRELPDTLRGELDEAARAATAATAGLGAFLSRELLPLAREKDACGPEVYARASRYFLGAAVDLAEASAGMPRSPGSSCWPTPAGTKRGCASSCTVISAGPGRPRPTSSANGSGSRPGTRPRHGPEPRSASRTSTPRRSAWAAWALTRCARPSPAARR
jgi:uncharacterized protein (DUF885 family)